MADVSVHCLLPKLAYQSTDPKTPHKPSTYLSIYPLKAHPPHLPNNGQRRLLLKAVHFNLALIKMHQKNLCMHFIKDSSPQKLSFCIDSCCSKFCLFALDDC